MKLTKKQQTKAIVWGLKDYYERRNRILVLRDVGGLGDILMQRMMFEGFKRVMPEAHITWAVPQQYLEAASHHPFVDEVVDCRTVDKSDFTIIYNITFACGRYESMIAPKADKHRSDIWSEHCGVVLSKHNMHLNVSDEEWTSARNILVSKVKNPVAPILVICPQSAQVGKDLSGPVITDVVLRMWQKGCNVVCLHTKRIHELEKIGCSVITDLSIRKWISAIAASDYVVSVDTAALHCAGGLGRPLTGIFTYCDGKVYGKYYDMVLVQKHRDNGDWDCGPCFNWGMCTKDKTANSIKPCAKEITSDLVMEGIEKMMARWPYKLENVRNRLS